MRITPSTSEIRGEFFGGEMEDLLKVDGNTTQRYGIENEEYLSQVLRIFWRERMLWKGSNMGRLS